MAKTSNTNDSYYVSNKATFDRFVKYATYGTIFVIALLAVMALTLV